MANETTLAPADQGDVIEFLEDGAFAAPVERIDTHAAVIFLTGDRALKMKRAVRFSFLDFTTLEARERALRAELELNRRTAPELYLGVLPVTRDEVGLTLDHPGEVVEWLLEMRRFPDDALFDRIAARGELTGERIDELARMIADFHGAAPSRPDRGGYPAMKEVVDGNAVDLEASAGGVLPAAEVRALNEATRAELEAHRELLEARREGGRVRHCHGDLHLRNIVLWNGRATLFDCIEFDEDFACIDVLYDLAFLLMDLIDRGLIAEAHRLLGGYNDRVVDDAGLALLPLFLSIRAAVRAKVVAFAAAVQADPAERRREAAEALRYLRLALKALEPVPARLIAIGGRSGTGKSSLAMALAPGLGATPGAVLLRSDVVRKRLFGREPHERLEESGYAPEVSDRVFRTIAERARTLVRAGRTVIADAVYGRAEQRESLERVARQEGVSFHGFWLEAPEPLLETRVEGRSGDASDATPAVVRMQRQIDPGSTAWDRVRSDRPLPGLMAEVRELIGLRD
ncbi:MAG TPA: AAA family ATPase [Geminicoccaceae bacterium]|nr:AAA family ATPase [Geminicoccaceae bacterium]